MNKTFSISRYISLFLLFLIGFILLSGFHINNQVVPPLNKIVPVTRNINSTKEIFVPARGSWNWIDLRLTNTPVQFAINGGNIIDSHSETYQIIRRSLPVGNEITIWAIPKGPDLNAALFFTNINRKPLIEFLADTSTSTGSMDSFQEIKTVNYDKMVQTYDVVQIVLNGHVLLPYNLFVIAKERTDKQLFWIWITFGALTLITGLYIMKYFITKNSGNNK